MAAQPGTRPVSAKEHVGRMTTCYVSWPPGLPSATRALHHLPLTALLLWPCAIEAAIAWLIAPTTRRDSAAPERQWGERAAPSLPPSLPCRGSLGSSGRAHFAPSAGLFMDGWSDEEIQQSVRKLQGSAAPQQTPTAASSSEAHARRKTLSAAETSDAPALQHLTKPSTLAEFRAGLPVNLFKRHRRRCVRSNCCMCRLARCAKRWMAATIVDKHNFNYSWLEARAPSDPAWGVGRRLCRLCYNHDGLNENGGVWARMEVCGYKNLQVCHVRKHGATARHMRARSAFRRAISGELRQPPRAGAEQRSSPGKFHRAPAET